MTDKEYLKTNIWKDTNWEIIGNAESRLVKKGFTPKIVDLAIQDAQSNNYTQELLGNPFYNLVIVAYDLTKTNDDAINRINALSLNLVQNYNVRTILLTSASAKEAEAYSKEHKLVSEIFYVDEVPLKEMVRSPLINGRCLSILRPRLCFTASLEYHPSHNPARISSNSSKNIKHLLPKGS